MLSHLIEILSRPSQLYFVAKQEKGYERGQVFQYKWNLGLTANAHHVSPTSAWSSAQLYREEQENYHQLWFRQILHDGWKPISCLLPCWWCKRKKILPSPFFAFLYILVNSHDILRFSCISLRDQKHIYEKRFSLSRVAECWKMTSKKSHSLQDCLPNFFGGHLCWQNPISWQIIYNSFCCLCASKKTRYTGLFRELSSSSPKTSLLLSSDEF